VAQVDTPLAKSERVPHNFRRGLLSSPAPPFTLLQSRLHLIAQEFSERVSGNPAGRCRIHFLNFLCGPDRSLVQAWIAFANLAQRPVDRLFDKIPLVTRSILDESKPLKEQIVGCFLVMHGQDSHHRKSRAPHKLPIPDAPSGSLLLGKWDFGKQMQTTAVAHRPIVEIGCPSIHLPARHFARIFNEAGQQTRLMGARRPKLLGEKVIFSNLTGERFQMWKRYSIDGFGTDAKAGHASNVV
jgi:hypothetical protein